MNAPGDRRLSPVELSQDASLAQAVERYMVTALAALAAMLGLTTLFSQTLIPGFFANPTFVALYWVMLATAVVLACGWILMRRGRVAAGLMVGCAGVYGAGIAGVLLNPQIAPVCVLGTLVSLTPVMLHLRADALRRQIWLVGMVAGVQGSLGIHNTMDAVGQVNAYTFLVMGVFIVVLAVFLTQMWQAHAWLSRTLADKDRATRALDESRASLEAQVQSRVAELRATNDELSARLAELEQAQRRLELLESVAVHANEAVAIMEPESLDNTGRHILYVNEAFTRMFGYRPDEVIGHTLRILQGPHTIRSELARVREALDHQQPVRIEMPNHHKDGHVVWGESDVVPVFGRDKRLIHWIWVTRDTTARKTIDNELRAERDFAQTLVDSIGQGLAVVRFPEGTYESANAAMATMLGVRVEDIIGTRPEDWLMPESHERGHEQLMRRQEGSPASFEVTVRRADGTPLPVLVSGAPRIVDGRVVGSVALITDLTRVKQTEDALREARDKAEEASQLKSQFLATISHEIRTPLNAIIGMTELALDTPLSAEQRELLGTVYEASESLLDVINDILDFSKSEAGRAEVVIETFDPSDVLLRVTEMLQRRAHAKSISLEMRVDPGAPRAIRSDPARVRQILANLIGNAIKFTERGAVRVSLSGEPGGAGVRYTVADTGIGISDAVRARLFEPFSQGDASTTRRFGGTGLGLAIAKNLVSILGGEMGYSSTVGQGSEFWFVVPTDPELGAGRE